MVTDTIADYFTRIRNAQMAGHKVVEIPASNLKKDITKILHDQGYILSYKLETDSAQGTIKIALKYHPKPKSQQSGHCRELAGPVSDIMWIPVIYPGFSTVWALPSFLPQKGS